MELGKSFYENKKRFSLILKTLCQVGIALHSLIILVFLFLEVYEMVYLNLFISIPCWILAWLLNNKGFQNLSFLFAFLEMLMHQIVATYLLGWDFGMQFGLIYMAGFSFFNEKWPLLVHVLLIFLIAITYGLLYYSCQTGVYSLSPNTYSIAYLVNAFSFIIVVSLLIGYFSKSTFSAERKMKAMLTKVDNLLGQQISQEIAEEMIQSEAELESKVFDVSILFLDIRDFTKFADVRSPSEVANFQNTVFSKIIDVIHSYEGIVLQLLGDGVMAVFGAPRTDKNHAFQAVQSGYQILAEIKSLADNEKIPKIRLGIGINSGNVLAGNLGNSRRRSYSLTGKNVIIAARIEQLNKTYGSEFLISESTYSQAHMVLNGAALYLGQVELKGIEEKIGLYKLMD
ncbi:adenylate/guanylate cyclase domain-containing protein [Roseivirga pacifica]|uniref:adenylate/guanylate cyclase domain-containing protein n=1 Tax=Roseivirga pacifica TaxID=1267423 RepID=UPI00227A0BF4|nr:adenylate/guanylate cyclase domain-containing protein [Roseivirga pacifica]